MRWHYIRILWAREVRDLLRDRRTVLLIFFVPVILYPALGGVGWYLARGMVEQKTVVGVLGGEHLPAWTARSALISPTPAVAWFSVTPITGMEGLAGTVALYRAARASLDFPPFVMHGKVPAAFCDFPQEAAAIQVVPVSDRALLADGQIDLLVVIPPGFASRLDDGGRQSIEILVREGDSRSRLAERRMRSVLNHWKQRLKEVRFLHQGLPEQFDDVIQVRRAQHGPEDHALQQAVDDLGDMASQMFPFMLIMWALAGALHPAIDLTAGEKERGTLETLLLSAGGRAEIVLGKFLAVWVFSCATSLWNLVWIGGGAWAFSLFLPFTILRFSGLFWCAVITVLLSALFSAISLSLGTYARSTKEGQYFLLPLFVVTMPLTFLPMLPGVELNLGYSLVPLTGATLLLQKLMHPSAGGIPWLYFVPVLASLAVSIALALRWTVWLFHREEVLFREAQGPGMWFSFRRH